MKKLIVAFALMASPAIAGPITDRLSETPGGTFASSKAPAELELCATDVVVSFSGLTPIIIRDRGNVHFVGWAGGYMGNHVMVTITLRPTASGTAIETRALRGLDTLNERVRACL